ncbi:MAG: galactokinase [Cyclobacteriaceae bacterium]|jgi:galactokinase|nr:galactokinase [Cyclobacteriaceae bacterium]
MTSSVDQFFTNFFHCAPHIFTAPGRINLMGEHVDYNEGVVMPAAVNYSFTFAMAAGQSDKCNVFAHDLQEGLSFSIYDLNPGETWVNYLMGVLDGFMRRGVAVRGVDVVFGGNIPSGAGMSSSAALCCGFATGLNDLFRAGLSKVELARIAQYAEHEFAGVNCGLMDQYASLLGEKDAFLLLDCRGVTHEVIPFATAEVELLLIDSKVKHNLAATAYNQRRARCEESVAALQQKFPQVRSLRDVEPTMLAAVGDALGPETWRRCRYVVGEMQRVQKAAQALRANDLTTVGGLMYQTHEGLRTDYEVSCAELDFLVALAAADRNHVPGARLMGGGFGGCTINLVKHSYREAFIEKVRHNYFAQFKKEPDFYSVKLEAGARLIA